MNKNIKISIIVPVYNVIQYIEHCIRSLINQTIDNYEIILINDGSTDGSNNLCEIYSEKYKNIKYISQKNQGQSVARNNGLKISKGEYILFVDADDYIIPETCEILYNTAKKHSVDIVVGDLLNEKEKIETNKNYRYCIAENKKVDIIEYTKDVIKNNMYDIVPWIRIVKKSFLIKNSIFFLENCYYEDQEYTMKLFTQQNGTIVKIRFPFYYYRMNRTGSTTNNATFRKGKDFLNVINNMQKIYNNDIKNIQYYCYGLAYYHFINLFLRINDKEKNILYKEFINLITKINFKEVISTLPKDKQLKIIMFYKYKFLLQIEYNIKNKLKLLIKK